MPEKIITCQHKDCTASGPYVAECTLTDYRGDVPAWVYLRSYGLIQGLRHVWELLTQGWTDVHEYYCAEHAKENGYCFGCGNFWAGNESFDFSSSIYCENCREEEYWEDEEEEYYGMIDDYYSDLQYEEEAPE